MRLIKTLGFAVILLSAGAASAGTTAASDFLIRVTWTSDQVILSCAAECDWEKLSFDYTPYSPVVIDNYRVTAVDREWEDRGDEDFAPFLISVTRTDRGISFLGHEGTRWTRLGFSCGPSACDQAINRDGMTE